MQKDCSCKKWIIADIYASLWIFHYALFKNTVFFCLQQQQQQAQQQQQQQQQQVSSPGNGNVGKGSPSLGNSSSPGTVATSKSQTEPKPVECNLCHRKFKNIPALNGHMRLHGGYFKKVNSIFDKDNARGSAHLRIYADLWYYGLRAQ